MVLLSWAPAWPSGPMMSDFPASVPYAPETKRGSGPLGPYMTGFHPSIKINFTKNKLASKSSHHFSRPTLLDLLVPAQRGGPLVYNMSHEDPGSASYSEIGGLSEQIRELREVIELPLTNPELFQRVGIIPLRAACYVFPVLFRWAKLSLGTSADREIQRTLMELLNQMDGFDTLHRVKMIMATNRPDTLDPALLRPGRLDRKIHIELPNEQARPGHPENPPGPITKHGEIDYESIVKLSDGFNGADLRNVCTEAGMFAIRADHEYVTQKIS
ncbi:hypothetical protein AAFF_G00100370 [Aldrovandia affinis]|uniref:Uncharacterized protein n=1 Tax=Aldrovandia affinis TaxID=143900 RepID=A0AAD7R189_9TELE|nr:hypothetical protein AAFF_G00100370 [Aldrovandia affinis]